MNAISDWIQGYWFEIGSLLLQLATLAAIVWFGRQALARLTAPQRYTEPSQEPADTAQCEAPQQVHRGLRGLIPLHPTPARSSVSVARTASANGNPLSAMVKWLKTPMKHDPALLWRRASRRVA